MVKSLLSWLVVGFMTYAWYWTGYVCSFLNVIPIPIWILFTIVVILVHRRNGVADVGANVFATMLDRLKTITCHAIGLIVAVMVGGTMNMIVRGDIMIEGFVQSFVLIVASAVITSLLVGALDDATQ